MKIREMHCVLYLSMGLLNVPLTAATFKVRLVNGPHQCAGRVEVFHSNSWGTVCDDHWSMTNGEVVCRETDCGPALQIKKSAEFGRGNGEIWMDDVMCAGNESSLTECTHTGFGHANCGHDEDAGVVCGENVRLVNGTGRCSGRVQVRYNGRWSKVCDSGWGSEQATVVCQNLRCRFPVTDRLAHFGAGSGTTGYTARCVGNETSFTDCKLQDFNQTCTDASVVCENNTTLLRLVNGNNRCSGRVEVYHEGLWGAVCENRWDMQEAEVVCRQTNCGTPLAVTFNTHFGQGFDGTLISEVNCVGHESSLADCPQRALYKYHSQCGRREAAGVICSDTVRLVNGTNRCSGRVEVNHDGLWGTICNSDWTTREATLMCTELDCGKPSGPPGKSQFGEATGLRGYTTSCTGNERSITQCSLQVHPTRCEAVSLTCSGGPHVRLANGTDRCSGRVEILDDGQWGRVCHFDWDMKDAEVVCRALNCESALRAPTSAFFGPGTGPVLVDNVMCVGNETSFDHCRHSTATHILCRHSSDASVICSNNIKLINGDNRCSGRVEVYHNDLWSPVYQQNWGLSEVEVVCREMDCGDPVIAPVSPGFGQGSGATGYTARCLGTERSITQCPLSTFVKTSQDGVREATVVCSGNVKLVNGSGPCAGRVEFFNESQWRTVCSYSWDMDDAHVVCRQLNCGKVHVVKHMAYLDKGSGKAMVESPQCKGQEASLDQCRQSPRNGINRCNQTMAAGVVCTESLEARLVGATDKCSGRVEVRHGGQWGTVCDQGWTVANADMVCKLLECGSAVIAPVGAHFGQGTGPSWEASDSCFGSETSLRQCSQRGFNQARCGHEKDAGVVCAEKLQLVNGRGNCSGRVEIFHDGQWGTVCDDDWGLRSAEVVCRQLGCGEAIRSTTSGSFGRGIGPIWLDNVNCHGQESVITQCSHEGFGNHNCGHDEDAGVVCYGSLGKPQITLSTASEVNLGDTVDFTCTIVTKELGGTFILEKTPGLFRMEQDTDIDTATFVLSKVNFDHTGSYSCRYHNILIDKIINYPEGDPVELSVAVRLDQPSISLTSPHAMVIFSKLEVNRGSSFSITCSIHSPYPGGFFYLTRSNISATDHKPVFSQTTHYLANFEFVADSEVQGDYRCIYGINFSTRLFSSDPSRPLSVTLTASSAALVSGVLGGLFVLLLLLFVSCLVWRRRRPNSSAMVMFSKMVGRGAKDDTANGFGVLDDRYNSVPENEYENSGDLEEKATEESALERTDEDLTGRMSFDHELLINP